MGVTEDTITVHVMADIGSALAPGLFQANLDAVKGFETTSTPTAASAAADLKVKTWDTKLDPGRGQERPDQRLPDLLAMVGGNSLFNPDVTSMNTCAGLQGRPHRPPRHRRPRQRRQRAVLPDLSSSRVSPSRAPPMASRSSGSLEVHRRSSGDEVLPDQDPNLTACTRARRPADHRAVGHAADRGPGQSGRDLDSAPSRCRAGTSRRRSPAGCRLALGGNANYVYTGSNDTVMVTCGGRPRRRGRQREGACRRSPATPRSSRRRAPTSTAPTSASSSCRSRTAAPTRSSTTTSPLGETTPDRFGAQAWMARGAVPAGGRRDRRRPRSQRHHPGEAARRAERHRLLRRQRLDGCQGPEVRVLRLHGGAAGEERCVRAGAAHRDGEVRLQSLLRRQEHTRPGGRVPEDSVAVPFGAVDERQGSDVPRPPPVAAAHPRAGSAAAAARRSTGYGGSARDHLRRHQSSSREPDVERPARSTGAAARQARTATCRGTPQGVSLGGPRSWHSGIHCRRLRT